ncbi:hypothetical protein Hdeb2414_s0002g00066491 [Helianthus debilis subsp. tardiflorus]
MCKKMLCSTLVPYNNVFLLKIVGLVIGTIAPFRRLLIGTTAPTLSASRFGIFSRLDTDRSRRDATVPAVTSIVGGNLLRGLKGSGISITLLLGIATVRYIFLPVFGILIVKGALYSSTTVRPSTNHEHWHESRCDNPHQIRYPYELINI